MLFMPQLNDDSNPYLIKNRNNLNGLKAIVTSNKNQTFLENLLPTRTLEVANKIYDRLQA